MDRPPTREEAHAPDYKNTTFERPCLACGYDLRGLGEEARCPECGLLNVSEGFRKQVQELVDSGTWFFSNPIAPWRKRPPGWFWSLDRPGDVRRSFRRMAITVALATILTFGATHMAGAVAVRFDTTIVHRHRDTGEILYTTDSGYGLIHAGCRWIDRYSDPSSVEGADPPHVERFYQDTRRLDLHFDWVGVWVSLLYTLLIVLTWLFPAYAGLVTQIRRNLSPDARAQRTILAAANFESHALIWTALVVAACACAELYLRQQCFLLGKVTAQSGWWYFGPFFVAASVPIIAGGFAWIGPLRSDSTGRLVRSRIHAVRIVVLYALLLPLGFGLGLIAYHLVQNSYML